MKDNIFDICSIIEIISGKKSFNDYKGIKIIDQYKTPYSNYYEVSKNGNNFRVFYPPLILSYQNSDKKIKIYDDAHLSTTLSELAEQNYYIKLNDENNTISSIKDSRNIIVKTLEYGLEYELIEKKENKTKEILSYKDFSNIFNCSGNFPKNCKYYKLYCKYNGLSNFKYVHSNDRFSFIRRINDFFYDDKSVLYITGQRGIGKSTSILYFLYTNNIPFFYINLKYFKKSKDDLEKVEIMDFEKNNLFQFTYEIAYTNINKKSMKEYNNELYILNEKINHLNYNDNISKIYYISLIIQILYVLYNKLDEIKNAKKDINIIEKELNDIINKIKGLNILEDIINKKFYSFQLLVKDKNLFELIKILTKYKSYLSYLEYCKDIPKYASKDIWDFIELLLAECKKLKLEFLLVLDQYKNLNEEKNRLDIILQRFEKSKILICSSIDDNKIREAIINGNHPEIEFQDKIISLEDIKEEYKDIFKNLSDKKKNAIELFGKNTREIFDCLNEKDENLKEYIIQKIDTIKNYFLRFCNNNFAKISTLIFIYNNIDSYWNEKNYKEIRKLIPFKYFIFEEFDSSSEIFKNYDFIVGDFELDDFENNKNNGKEKDVINSMYSYKYFKINYSMPIVSHSLYEFIKEQDNILFFEQYMQVSNKGSGKGITFEEHIKSKISKKKIIPIEGLNINKRIEIWSVFSKKPNDDIPCLFEGKLDDNQIYFIDMRKENEKLFDCAILDLIKKEILFVQITTNKDILNDAFNRDKIKKYSKKAVEFLTGNLFDEYIQLDVGYFLIFLKYDLENDVKEYVDDSSKILYFNMNNINKHLEKMIKKCNEEKLKYCVYTLPSILSKHNKEPNAIFTKIKPNDENLYIMKKKDIYNEEENEDENDEEEYEEDKEDNSEADGEDNNKNDKEEKERGVSLKRKRSYMEMMFKTISLEKINPKKNSKIKKFYDYYCDLFNLGKTEIFVDKELYTFEKLKTTCEKIMCFGIVNNNANYRNYMLTNYFEQLRVFDINTKLIINFDNGLKDMLYEVYFFGVENVIKSTLILHRHKDQFLPDKIKKED